MCAQELSDGLGYSSFRRLILKNCFQLKLDGRAFSQLARALDPDFRRVITYEALERHVAEEAALAKKLGLGLEVAVKQTLSKSASAANYFSKSFEDETAFVGAGVTTRRLKKELKKARSTALMEPLGAAQARAGEAGPGLAAKPRRGLLRHEITELKGAGILLNHDVGNQPMPQTVAQMSWKHPATYLPTILASVASHE